MLCRRSREQDHERIDVRDLRQRIDRWHRGDQPRVAARTTHGFRYVRQPENLGAAAQLQLRDAPQRWATTTRWRRTTTSWARASSAGARPCWTPSTGHRAGVPPDPLHRGWRGEPLGAYEDPLVWRHDPTAHGRLRDLFVEEQRSHASSLLPDHGGHATDAALRTRGIQAFRAADAAMLVDLALLGDFRRDRRAALPQAAPPEHQHAGELDARGVRSAGTTPRRPSVSRCR